MAEAPCAAVAYSLQMTMLPINGLVGRWLLLQSSKISVLTRPHDRGEIVNFSIQLSNRNPIT